MGHACVSKILEGTLWVPGGVIVSIDLGFWIDRDEQNNMMIID